jgi:hypothetical protein
LDSYVETCVVTIAIFYEPSFRSALLNSASEQSALMMASGCKCGGKLLERMSSDEPTDITTDTSGRDRFMTCTTS